MQHGEKSHSCFELVGFGSVDKWHVLAVVPHRLSSTADWLGVRVKGKMCCALQEKSGGRVAEDRRFFEFSEVEASGQQAWRLTAAERWTTLCSCVRSSLSLRDSWLTDKKNQPTQVWTWAKPPLSKAGSEGRQTRGWREHGNSITRMMTRIKRKGNSLKWLKWKGEEKTGNYLTRLMKGRGNIKI